MVMAPGGNLPGNLPGSLAPADPRVTGEPTSGTLLFLPDGTYDIGALNASRPRDVYIAGNIRLQNNLIMFGNITNVNSIATFQVSANIVAIAGGPMFYGGTAPPGAGSGANGDFYFNTTGGALTTIYQKRGGAWVGIV